MANGIHVYSEMNFHKNELKNVVLQQCDNNNKPSNPRAGQAIYNTTTGQIEWWDGQHQQWVSGSGATGALIPKGTVGEGGDQSNLPTENVNPGDCYFVVSDGMYGPQQRQAFVGDFFFAREVGSGETFKIFEAVAHISDTEEQKIYVKEGTFEDHGDKHPCGKDGQRPELYNEDGTPYEVTTGDGFDFQEDGGEQYVVYKKGTETYRPDLSGFEKTVGDDISWALVPSGNGYVIKEISGPKKQEEQGGQSEFQITNLLRNAKCSVTVTAHSNGRDGFEINEGEVVMVDTRITTDDIYINFGHPLFSPDSEGLEDYEDDTTFTVKVAYC